MSIYRPGSAPPTKAEWINGITYRPRMTASNIMQTWGSPLTHTTPRFALCNAIARDLDARWTALSPAAQAPWIAQAALYAGAPTPPCVAHRKLMECEWWWDGPITGPALALGKNYHRGANFTNWEFGGPYMSTPPAPKLLTDSTSTTIDATSAPTLLINTNDYPVHTQLACHTWARAHYREPPTFPAHTTDEFITRAKAATRFSYVGPIIGINGGSVRIASRLAAWSETHPGRWVEVALAIGPLNDSPATSNLIGIVLP